MKTINSYYHSKDDFLTLVEKENLIEKATILIQIFSSELDKNILQNTINNISTLLPQAKIIGATTDGEILENIVTVNKIIVSITLFEKATLEVAIVENRDDSFSCGKELVEKIIQDDTKSLILFSDGLHTN
ncbi:MAG: hypothetical protein COA39_007200 [Sulfurimonas sp.]|nr:hypothetical protein [Sulfurimonas sp.]